jgi:hypothetical protein
MKYFSNFLPSPVWTLYCTVHITLSINVQHFNLIRSIEPTTYPGAHAVNCSVQSLSSQPETPAFLAVARSTR